MIRNCLVCGKEINTCPSWNTQYCSRECYAKSMMKRRTVICSYCGKPFDIPLSSNQKCCSKKCSDASRRGVPLAPQISKICPVCGKMLMINHLSTQTFCSRKCGCKGRKNPSTHNVTPEGLIAKRKNMEDKWNDPTFRAKVIDRMKNNNPSKNSEVVAKIKEKLKGRYSNNFRYGNGKISPYEQKVSDKLVPLGFVYNYAISTKQAREQFPDMNYAHSYKPDFVNLTDKLCIEVDGSDHETPFQQELDRKKESCLKFLGYSVIRFTHRDIDEGRFDKWLDSYQKDM